MSPLAIAAVVAALAGTAMAQSQTYDTLTTPGTSPAQSTSGSTTVTDDGTTTTVDDDETLPATAGSLPLLELGGLAALAAGLSLRHRERR